MDIIDIRTGNISYTVANNSDICIIDKSILIDFTNYTWRYTIELEGYDIILSLHVDKDNYIEDKRDHIRSTVQNYTTIYQLYDLRANKYSFVRQLLDKLYKEIHNKYNIVEIPKTQKTEFDNKIIYDYMDIWHYTMK